MAENPSADLTILDSAAPKESWLGGVWHTIIFFSRQNPLAAISGLVLLAIIAMAVFAPVVAPYHPIDDTDYSQIRKGPTASHVVGTDDIGRDVLSRIIYGARVSLFVAFIAVAIGDLFGALWGIASGYLGGRFDIYSQRFLELLMSFPTLILAMVLLLGLGAGITTVIIAIAITRIPLTVRVIRSVVLGVKENTYIEAARAVGCSNASQGPRCSTT